MSRDFSPCRTLSLSFPRVSGDEPAITGEDADFVQFSPRERG